MASTAPLLVLTDRDLLPRIGAFTRGVPFALVDFWQQFKPAHESPLEGFSHEPHRVVKKLVQYGTLRLLELATRVWLPNDDAGAAPNPLNMDSIVTYAAQYRRPEMMQWGFTNAVGTIDDDAVDVWYVVLREYCDGDVPLLDVLKKHLPISEQDLLDHVFEYGEFETPSMELVRWLDEHVEMPKVMARIAKSAAFDAKLAMVQFLYERGVRFRSSAWTFEVLSERQQWDMLVFLLEHNLIKVDLDAAMKMVLSGEAVVIQLVRRFASKFQSAFEAQVRKQVEKSDADKLCGLLNNDAFTIDFPISIDGFADHHNLDVIMLLHEKGLAIATTDAMDIAAEKGYWDIVEFLHENRSEGCTTRALDAAARWENLKYVKLLNENWSAGCTTAAMDEAATGGHLTVLRYLHEKTTTGCTTAAMGGAAQNGHLDVVKFLHEHRHEGCTVAAMNEAAAYGHLDVVRYLHENRHEGCTVDAVKMALRYSQAQVVAFLYEKCPHFFGPEILHDVLLRGAFGLFMDLRTRFPEHADAVVGDVAFQAGKEYELPTIRFIVNVLKREDVMSRVVDGALSERYRALSRWPKAIAAITGKPNWALIVKEQLHPFLVDPRAPSWAVAGVLGCCDGWSGPHARLNEYGSWTLRAVYANDLKLLKLIHDTPRDAYPPRDCKGAAVRPEELERQLSFTSTRSEAIYTNNLPILQWLVEEVELPIEPTLLSESVYLHRYEIAEWLVANCPEACQESKWLGFADTARQTSCGLDDDLLHWLETHPAVRAALDFGPIIDWAVEKDDATSLRNLFERFPELVLSRSDLAAKAKANSDVLVVLKEIG